ncbi:MAG: FkbM family methyltransferase [Flavobacterium sp.]|uniref:FkbM family methyltransferase n=1 Tax=Flavobacterium sp. TaxID=239 RepID=UPI003BE246F8
MKTFKNFNIHYRENTTDDKVIIEVLKTNVYEKKKINFTINENENWLDLGGNIGTFSLLCLSKKANVITYEPEPDNFELLTKNVETNFPTNTNYKLIKAGVGITTDEIPLYICKGDYNKYRHTIYKKRGRESITIKIQSILDVLREHKVDCIKMDIEGAEIDILELLKPEDYRNANIQKLVFEYSFDFDKSIPRFLKIVDTLKEYFRVVEFSKFKEGETVYNYFPCMKMVYCMI